MCVITIRGQLGSGAPEIGSLAAGELCYGYVDREIIAKVAAILHRREQDVAEKEMPPTGFLGRIAEAIQHSYVPGATSDGKYIQYLPPVELPLDDSGYLAGLVSVVRELAAQGSIVICGRGSQFILKEHPGVLHVLTIAPLELRVGRVMEGLKLDEESARKRIASYDSSRREFIRRHFRADLEDPKCYDLVISTEHLDFKTSASLIVHAVPVQNRA